MVVKVNNKTEFRAKLEEAGDKLVVVDFFATWCGPCKMIAPNLEVNLIKSVGKRALDSELPNLVVLKVDVDEAEDLSAEFEITAMPTFLFFKNKEQVEKLTGANLPKLKELITKHVPA